MEGLAINVHNLGRVPGAIVDAPVHPVIVHSPPVVSRALRDEWWPSHVSFACTKSGMLNGGACSMRLPAY